MTNIKETVEKILEKIKKHRPLYEQNEAATRGQLVNPILRGLGWDTENPEDIQENAASEDGKPDYTLSKNGKIVLFIEAKKLSVDIEKLEIIQQLVKYCNGNGIKYGVLSNGGVWLLFRTFEEGKPIAKRIVWKIDIENDDITASVKRLNTISKENIEDIEMLNEKLQILDKVWLTFLEEPRDLIMGLIPIFQNLIKEGYPQYSFGSPELEDFIKERVQQLLLPSSQEFDELPVEEPAQEKGVSERQQKMRLGKDSWEIRSSYEILMNTANWLIKQGKLKFSDAPIEFGHKRYLINKEPKHKYGDTFKAPKKLSNGLWLESNRPTVASINDARRLLEKFGYPGKTLDLQ